MTNAQVGITFAAPINQQERCMARTYDFTFNRDQARQHEGGWAIDVGEGRTEFISTSRIVSLTDDGPSVRVTLGRSDFRRLTSAPKNQTRGD